MPPLTLAGGSGGTTMIRETERRAVSGFAALALFIALLIACIAGVVRGAQGGDMLLIFGSLGLAVLCCIALGGLFVVNPNEGRVLQLFGSYVGTVRQPGLRFANPFYSKRRISLRVRNFESAHLKVNDIEGNPIEIAAVVVWRVVDSAEACFEVDNYENYVHVQSEAAVRNLATSYSYDSHDDKQISLRGHTAQIADHMKAEIQERLAKAGVEVIEARISHLAYAPEIASAMLQRQQAGAIIAARQRIVDGAVGMVEMALERLDRNKVVTLDGERKAAMVSNLLVVLCGERAAQPVLNTGTLYQ
jgi:regulator of protease activity HflC (stomatin/prohibitin superfamily)